MEESRQPSCGHSVLLPPSDQIRVHLALGADLIVVLNDIPRFLTILACLNNR
jgi:hypothetical protein